MPSMNNQQIAEKAQELLECLGMWGIDYRDGVKIVRKMREKIQLMTSLPNPLEGTGLKPLIGDEEDRQANIRQRLFHEPKGEA